MKDSYDDSDHGPDAAIIIGRLRKKSKPNDGQDETDPSDEGRDSGKVDEEAQLAACEDAIAAIRDKDAQALRDALASFCDARGY